MQLDSTYDPLGSIPKPQDNSLIYASMGLSIMGSISETWQSVVAARARGDYEKSIADMNATLARIQGQQALETGNYEAAKKEKQTEQLVGSIKAQQAGSGTDVNTGSNALVRSSVSNSSAMDVLTIKNNAARQAWGYDVQAINDTAAGEMSKLTAKSEENQSILNGGLKSISGPLAIGVRYLGWSKYMGGDGSKNNRLPFDLTTN